MMKLPSDAEFLMLVRDKLARDSNLASTNGLCGSIEQVHNDLIAERMLLDKSIKNFMVYCDHVSLIEHRMLKWIDDMLSGYVYLHHFLWQDTRTRQEMRRMAYDDYLIKLKSTRLAWLDWMIAYCLEKDGK